MITRLTLRHPVRLLGVRLFEARLTLALQPAFGSCPSEIAELDFSSRLSSLFLKPFLRAMRELGLAKDGAEPLAVVFTLDPNCDDPVVVAHPSVALRLRDATAHQVMRLRRDPRVVALDLAA